MLPLSEKGDYRTANLWLFVPVTKDTNGKVLGYHAPTGIVPGWLAKARAYGFTDLDETFFDPETYGVPPPPMVHGLGESVTTRWAPSLQYRGRGESEPTDAAERWQAFEKNLKSQAARAAPVRDERDDDKTPPPAMNPLLRGKR